MSATHTPKNRNEGLISALMDCGAVRFGDFTLASGKKSKYYIDIKKASSDPATLGLIARQAADIVKNLDVDRVGGVVLGGVPLATAVSLKTGLPLFLIRKATKEYGTGGRFVGDLETGDRIILLEDVTTSGGSVMEAISAIRETNGVVDMVITVVDREEGAKESLGSVGVTLLPLVEAHELLEAGNDS